MGVYLMTGGRNGPVGQQGHAHTSVALLKTFDALSDTFRRTMRNPAMIGHWEELTEQAISDF